MAVKRLTNLKQQYLDSNGLLANGYRLFFYASGSSTKQNTYNSSAGTIANSNPITLNALGEAPGEIWLTTGLTYKVGLAIAGVDDPPGAFVWTEDVVAGVNDTTAAVDQWLAGPAPTYISATSFSLLGDQTSTFTVGRRVKTTNTGGTTYSTIITSAFGAGITTITVRNDSGTIDSGLSAASYGIVSSSNTSLPAGATPGTATNNSAAAGFVGEYIESIVSAVNFPTTNQYGDLTSISLTAGDWDVSLVFEALANGATVSQVRAGISITTGNSATGLVFGSNALNTVGPTAASDAVASIPAYRMLLSGTTTVYAKFLGAYTVATPQGYGRLSARRVR